MMKNLLVFTLCAALSAPVLAGGYGGRHYYGGHHGGHYGYRHHGGGDAGTALVAGLLIGGLAGYFISEDHHYRRDGYRHGPYRYRYTHYDYDHRYDYGGRVYRHEVYRPVAPRRVLRVPPRPQRVTAAAPVDREFAGAGCRMTREYSTTVEIDGRKRDAYGTKCLAADGSWILGRLKLAPEFE